MAIDDKTKGLLLKLKALAEKGVDGEKENAQQMLERCLKKNGLTLEDLDSVTEKEFEFKVEEKFIQLFKQFLHSEFIVVPGIYTYRNKRVKKNRDCLIICADIDKGIYLQCRWELIKRAFEKEQKIWYTAFIDANELWALKTQEEPMSASEVTAEQLADYFKMKKMSKSIEKVVTHKQITNG